MKQASGSLLVRLQELPAPMGHWTHNAQTQAEVQTSILDWLYESLPGPPFTEEEAESLARSVYDFVWQQSEGGSVIAA